MPPLVGGILSLNNKSKPGPRQLTVVEDISALSDKSEPGPRKPIVVESFRRVTTRPSRGCGSSPW